jgi:CheY-like chemotaxis protein
MQLQGCNPYIVIGNLASVATADGRAWSALPLARHSHVVEGFLASIARGGMLMATKVAPALILLVEDSVDVRQSMEWLLTMQGYAVVTAIHGADALRKLRGGLVPCLILLDLQMPEMDGFEFRTAQLQDPQLARIPVVVYSGFSDARTAAGQLNATAYLQKPLDLDALLTVVEKCCGKPVRSRRDEAA